MPDNPRIEELRRRVQSDPTSIAFAALAEEYRRTGRHQEAIDVCRTGLQRHPAYLSARVTLGRALIEVGDFEGARTELETVLASAPENLAAIRGLAQIHERLGQSTEMHPDLAALAAQPFPVREPPAAPALRVSKSDPIDTARPAETLKIDLRERTAGKADFDIDLPSPSPVHQTIDIDLPLERGAREDVDMDLPAALDTAGAGVPHEAEEDVEIPEPSAPTPIPDAPIDVAAPHTAPVVTAPIPVSPSAPPAADSPRDATLEKLEQFLVAVQSARTARAGSASAPPGRD